MYYSFFSDNRKSECEKSFLIVLTIVLINLKKRDYFIFWNFCESDLPYFWIKINDSPGEYPDDDIYIRQRHFPIILSAIFMKKNELKPIGDNILWTNIMAK